MSYLYLFYSDYVANNGDPIQKIYNVKQQIKERALGNFSKVSTSSSLVEQAFEQHYNLQPNEFGAIDVTNIEKMSESNSVMTDFDSAIAELKVLIADGGTVAKAQELGQQAIIAIDKLLEQGATTGGLAEGAMSQLKQGLKKMREAQSLTKYKGGRGKKHWAKEEEILSLLSDIESNVSGYALEVGFIYGFIGAGQYSLKQSHETMINIGSDKIRDTVYKTFKEDPTMLADLQKLTNALSENNGQQSKADSVVNMHMSDGQGSVTGTATWVGFQQKNYRDISKITVMRDKTLESLGFFNYYDTDMAVNVAGSLGNNYRNSTLNINYWNRRSVKSINSWTQGDIDQIWNGMVNSMKVLAAADAVAGEMGQNITNRINYYVIREKGTSQIRVIGVSKILDKIAKAISSEWGESELGINWGFAKSGRYTHREKFWNTSITNFDPSKKQPEAKLNRSNKSYNTIIKTILSTKISISLNFSSFFGK